MARIYDSGNTPRDFCKGCFPDKAEAEEKFQYGPEDEDHFEYNADHPPYSDGEFNCAACGRRLTDQDNDS